MQHQALKLRFLHKVLKRCAGHAWNRERTSRFEAAWNPRLSSGRGSTACGECLWKMVVVVIPPPIVGRVEVKYVPFAFRRQLPRIHKSGRAPGASLSWL